MVSLGGFILSFFIFNNRGALVMSQQSSTEFSGLRSILWPIHGYELKKFLPMALIMLCVLFNYSVLRNTKDALVVNAAGSGAEVLSFIKLYCVMPIAILVMVLYMKLSNVLKREALFYSMTLPFVVFFALFALIIHPNKEILHMDPNKLAHLQAIYPHFKWFLAVIGSWSYALFYTLSELWGSVVLSLLFWQFANQITKVHEAKRFYPLFGLIGNFGLLFAGYSVSYFSGLGKRTGISEEAASKLMINYLMSFVVLIGIVMLITYWWINKNVLNDVRYYDGAVSDGSKKSKPKLGLKESFKYIFTSSYLGCIVALLLAYGISINLIEGVWKSQIKIAFPNSNEYNAFMGQFSMYTAVATMVLMLVGSNIMRIFTWRTAALITPSMLLISGLVFFGLIIYSSTNSPFTPVLGTTVAMLAVIVGTIQNVLTKSTKYSLFDPTKEMAYIPLPQELKTKGKAAVDVVGGRLGKSGGAVIQSTLLLIFSNATLPKLSPILAVIVVLVVILWIVAAVFLSVKFDKAMQDNKSSV
jgi:AAA family ATP:ADP antiporter